MKALLLKRGKTDRHEEYEKMTKDQLSSWRAFYGPRDKDFTKRNFPVKSLFVGNGDTPIII